MKILKHKNAAEMTGKEVDALHKRTLGANVGTWVKVGIAALAIAGLMRECGGCVSKRNVRQHVDDVRNPYCGDGIYQSPKQPVCAVAYDTIKVVDNRASFWKFWKWGGPESYFAKLAPDTIRYQPTGYSDPDSCVDKPVPAQKKKSGKKPQAETSRQLPVEVPAKTPCPNGFEALTKTDQGVFSDYTSGAAKGMSGAFYNSDRFKNASNARLNVDYVVNVAGRVKVKSISVTYTDDAGKSQSAPLTLGELSSLYGGNPFDGLALQENKGLDICFPLGYPILKGKG